jgi:hypothetical protein
MSEIKRYDTKQVRHDSGNYMFVDFAEHPDGEWVRWEDLQGFLKRLEKLEHDEEIRNMYTTVMGRPL